MTAQQVMAAFQVGDKRRVLRCFSLDHEGFDVPDPIGIGEGEELEVQIRTLGRRMYTVRARAARVADGRLRMVFVNVPRTMVDALVEGASRAGVYKGSKPVVSRDRQVVRSVPFGGVLSAGQRSVVEIESTALQDPEAVAQIRSGTICVRHSTPPEGGTMVVVRLPLPGRKPRFVNGYVEEVEGRYFKVTLEELDAEARQILESLRVG